MSKTLNSRITELSRTYQQLVKGKERAIHEITMSSIPEQVYNSNAIENSTLTLKDTEDILIHGQIKKDAEIREIYEAKNLANVIELLAESASQNLTVELILAIHRILLTGINDKWAGRFRSGDEWVRVGSHIGANPQFINSLVYQLVDNYHRTDDREFLAKIAYFHAEFEYIHPFNDGNGRVGRVLINQQLSKLNLPPIIIPAKNKHQEYYPTLDIYQHQSSADALEDYLALLLLESLHKYITILTTPNIIPLAKWAEDHKASPQSMLNKAKRQTIPAFRSRGQWMIAAGFVDTPEVELA